MKINPVIYKKLLAQAEEAREQGLVKLADGILNAIGSYPSDEMEEYSHTQLRNDIHNDIWKSATRLMYYYDVKSIDAAKLDETLVRCASDMLEELESALGVNNVIGGPSEPKLPGQD